MKRKITLTILVILLILCASSSCYIFLSKRQSKVTPSEFPFLEGYLSSSNCDEKYYEFETLIYSPKVTDNKITFDMNIIDNEERGSKYVENISIPTEKIYIRENDITNSFVGLVKIRMYFETKSLNIFTNDFPLKSVIITNIEEKDLRTDNIVKSIFTSITTNPLTEEEPALPRSTYIYTENQKYVSEYSKHPDNQELYYLWLNSFAERNWDNTNIQSLFKEKPDTKKLIKEEKEYIINDRKEIGENVFLSKFTHSCKLINDIEENIGEIDKEIKDYYCNTEYLKNSIEILYDHYKNTNPYNITTEQFKERIIITNTGKEDAKNYQRENNSKLSLLEAYWNSDIKKSKELEKKGQFGVENSYYTYMESNNNIQNQCTLAYAYSLAYKREKDKYYKEILDLISSSISFNYKNSLKAFENSVYSSVLCYEAFKDDHLIGNLVKSNLYKMIILNNYNSESKIGIWENYDEYDLKTNALILNILLLQND